VGNWIHVLGFICLHASFKDRFYFGKFFIKKGSEKIFLSCSDLLALLELFPISWLYKIKI
jgi:hypothetical protein